MTSEPTLHLEPRAGSAVPQRGVIARYRDWLPVPDTDPVITLGEGNTPLVQAEVLSDRLGCEVWLKVEGANPTGSFKDRGMTVAVSVSAGDGAEAVVCASTGNTSASAAAYAAKAGLLPIVLLPAGRSRPASSPRRSCTAPRWCRSRATSTTACGWPATWPTTTRWPWSTRSTRSGSRARRRPRSRSSTTSATPPTCTCCRSGNGGNISAYWRGYTQYAEAGLATRTPRMWGFQAAGAAPLVLGHPVREPETVATAIRIGNPASTEPGRRGPATNRAVCSRPSPTSRSLLRRRSWPLGRASSSNRRRPPGWPGCSPRLERGEVAPGQQIVVTVTGHGLKDIDTALSAADAHPGRGRAGRADRVASACGFSG